MKIEFLESSIKDLVWLDKYYTKVFEEGSKNAYSSISKINKIILIYPEIGHPLFVDKDRVIRKISIPRTPFSYIYFVDNLKKIVFVIRVLDDRTSS